MTIKSFQGPTRWLSNFHSFPVEFEGDVYPSTEAAYQAAKLEKKIDRKSFQSMNAKEAKEAGGRITVRKNWTSMNLAIMKNLNHQKFQDPTLRAKLLATGDEEIIEGNTWGDTFWGVCNGVGENHLGRILMEIRDEIRAGQAQKTLVE